MSSRTPNRTIDHRLDVSGYGRPLVRDIFGQGDLEPAMKDMVRSLGLESRVRFHGFVSESELLDHLLTSDCGVVSLYRTPASDLTHTYKMYEYVELGIPTIITRTSAVEAYFDSACFYYFESGDADGLADGIIDLARKPEKRRALAAHARRFSR